MYSLEQVDDENKRRQAAMGNVSASNDPQQQVHDSNEQLIKGAEVLGAGRTLGLTDDETLDTKRATLRREQRARRAQRGERAGNEAAARAFLAQDDAQYTFVGKPEEDSDYPDPFGTFKENKVVNGRVVPAGVEDPSEQDLDQIFSADEREERGLSVREGPDPELVKQSGRYVRRNGVLKWEEGGRRYDSPDDVKFRRDPDIQRHFPGNTAVAEESARRLRDQDIAEGKKAAAEERRRLRGDLTPSEIDREVEKRIAARTPSPNVKNPSMPVNLRRDIAEELLSRHERNESGGFDFQKMINDRKASKEAAYIASRGRGLPRQLADEDIGRIDEIRSLGNASSVGHGDNSPGNIQVVRTDSPANFGQAVQMVDPTGKVVGYADQQVSHFLGDVNADSSDNVLNAPLSAGQKFVVDNLPDYGREGGTSFGDKGVSIMAELQQFGDRMRGLQGYGYEGFSKNPRSVEEIEKAIANIVGRGQEMGDTFYTFDSEGNKTVASSEPGFNEVLYKMRYSEPEKQRLAYALQQLQMAELSPVNQEQKAAFKERRPRSSIKDDVIFDAPEFKPDGDSALAKIKNEKVGRGKKAKSVRAELANLSTPGAAMPFYGAAEGDEPNRARFIRGENRGRSEADLVKQYGPMGMVGAEVERRYKEDRAAKQSALEQGMSTLQSSAMKADADFTARGRQIEQERARAALTAQRGPNPVNTQPIRPASMPTSIAPEPGTGSGNQPIPAIDAGGGGMMGGGPKPPASSAMPNPPDNPMPGDLRRELNRISKPKWQVLDYMTAPDGARSSSADARERRLVAESIRRDNRNRRGAAALGAGTAAVLAGILGTRKPEEEEEQY